MSPQALEWRIAQVTARCFVEQTLEEPQASADLSLPERHLAYYLCEIALLEPMVRLQPSLTGHSFFSTPPPQVLRRYVPSVIAAAALYTAQVSADVYAQRPVRPLVIEWICGSLGASLLSPCCLPHPLVPQTWSPATCVCAPSRLPAATSWSAPMAPPSSSSIALSS